MATQRLGFAEVTWSFLRYPKYILVWTDLAVLGVTAGDG